MTEPPRIGETVRDTLRRRVGVVMGHHGPHVQLRPLGGGREWDAHPGSIELLTRPELLQARLAAVNKRSREQRS